MQSSPRESRGGFLAATVTMTALVTMPARAQLSQWTDVATPELSGQNHEGHRGAAWGDFNGDGLIDLYVTHWGPAVFPDPLTGSANQLFQNFGNGVLLDVTMPPLDVPGTPEYGLSHHPAWGDIDNDGLLDIFVTQSANFCQDGSHLFHQTAPGVFADVPGPVDLWCTLPRAVSWVDYDRDGFLDLFTTNSGGDELRNRLMRNQGDGTFVRIEGVMEELGRESRGAAWCDFNNDGLQDLYIGNGAESNAPEINRANALFLNVGNRQFVDIAAYAGVQNLRHARGVAWGDVNNDGWFDLLVGNNSGQDATGHNALFINNGDLTFTDVAVAAGISENRRTRDVSFADYDNDGLLDMYAVSFGSLLPPNRLWRNNGDGTFTDVAAKTCTSGELNGSAAAWGDFDADGWVDLYVVGGSDFAPGEGMNLLCRNDNQNGNHWLEVDLVGTESNRLAIGARVTVIAGGVKQLREVQSGCGYNAQHMHRVHVGLGVNTVVDSLEINWPSGRVQTLTAVAVDQILTVVEDTEAPIVDCDDSGRADVLEIDDGTLADCDLDGIPDVCDDADCDDCNDNGRHDLIDALQGWSEDCNDNFVPDECELAADPDADGNGNGILDACELLGDADGDGFVDVNDLVMLIQQWGPCNPGCDADFDYDDDVDVDDLVILIQNWT